MNILSRCRLFFIPVIIGFCFSFNNMLASAQEYIVTTAGELQRIFENPVDSVSVLLQAGEYHLSPIAVIDSTCGNCEDPNIKTNTTAGLILTGKWIKISGPPDRSAVIYTNAGYGLFIHRTDKAIIENLVITGGIRTYNGNATDAAVVVKESEAYLIGNEIRDNIGDPEIVSNIIVGIAGIAGRENARLFIKDNEIIRNSWDGIALYRGATAVLERNYIDGVDKATGQNIGGGRGVGIGVTRDATAIVRNNLVTRYWKGIGVFVDAEAEILYNIVEDIVTWGIALWSAGEGTAGSVVDNNVIYKTGACGASVSLSDNSSGGRFRNNIIVESGQNPRYDDPEYYCVQTALAIGSAPDKFSIENSLFYNNRRFPEDLPDYDLTKREFTLEMISKCAMLHFYNFSNRSAFMKSFCL